MIVDVRLLTLAAVLIGPGAFAQTWVDPEVHPISTDLAHGQRAIPHDMNDDGAPDLLLAYSLADAVWLGINDGDGDFTLTEIGSDVVAMYAVPLDADCDDDTDVAAVELFDRDLGFESAGRLLWYERPSDLTGDWTEHLVDDTLVHFYRLDAADVDGDGDDDLLTATVSSTFDNVVVWYENRCDESAGPRWQRWTIADGAGFGECGSVRLADLDRDEDLDVIAADPRNDVVVWFENDGTPRSDDWTAHVVAAAAGAPASVRLAHLDDDEDPDLLVALSGAGQVGWLENPGDPTDADWTFHPLGDLVGVTEVAFADLDNDGRDDVAAGSGLEDFGGVNTLAIFERNPDGTTTRHLDPGNYYGFTAVEAADLDRDGDQDLVTASYGGDRMDWWENRHDPVSPVTLTRFEARVLGPSRVEVVWTASTEVRHRGYELRRTGLGGDEEAVGPDLVPGGGGGTYRIVDPSAPAGREIGYTLTAIALDGEEQRFGPVWVRVPGLVGGGRERLAVAPHPVSGGTRVTLDHAGGAVELLVVDPSGRRVRTLLQTDLAPGTHRVGWDATDHAGRPLAPGTYFLRIRTPAGTSGRRIVVVE